MRILVIGGTWFLGKSITERALVKGWDVTTFNRGRSGVDAEGVRPVHGDRTVREDLDRLAGHGPWDAVIDTSSSDLAPRDVRLATSALRDAARRWVHISTVSVYKGWPHQPLTDASPLAAQEIYPRRAAERVPLPRFGALPPAPERPFRPTKVFRRPRPRRQALRPGHMTARSHTLIGYFVPHPDRDPEDCSPESPEMQSRRERVCPPTDGGRAVRPALQCARTDAP